jgi:hypothetical protein
MDDSSLLQPPAPSRITVDKNSSLVLQTDFPFPPEGSSHGTPLAPSVEKAYYRKCIELKRRLTEVEAANDEAKIRRVRLDRAIMKMRLERAFLLDELRKRMEHEMVDSEGSGEEGVTTVCEERIAILPPAYILTRAATGRPPTPRQKTTTTSHSAIYARSTASAKLAYSSSSTSHAANTPVAAWRTCQLGWLHVRTTAGGRRSATSVKLPGTSTSSQPIRSNKRTRRPYQSRRRRYR